MLEKTIQNKVREYAERLGMKTYKMSSEKQRGFPDVLFLYEQGICFYVEFKRPKCKPTALQIKTIKELKERGQKVFVIDDISLGRALINSIVNNYENAK